MARRTKIVEENMGFHSWCIERAEWFNITILDKCETVVFRQSEYRYTYRLDAIEKSLVFPVLLQRAIEGVNRKGAAIIDIGCETIEVQVGMNLLIFRVDSETPIDQTKESALKYIYEQEKK